MALGARPPASSMSITSDELNFLVYRYLHESGGHPDRPACPHPPADVASFLVFCQRASRRALAPPIPPLAMR